MRPFALLFVCILSWAPAGYLAAQLVTRAERPTHEYAFGDIAFMRLSEFGTLLVGHANGLAAVDPTQPKPVFNFEEFGRINESEVIAVPLSPYIIVTKGAGGGSGGGALGGIGSNLAAAGNAFGAKGRKAILDAISGEKLYDTKTDGNWKSVQTFDVFLPENVLVVSGMSSENKMGIASVGVYDLGAKKSVGLVELKSDVLTGKPLLSNGRLYIPTMKALICADVKTGTELWRTKTDDITWLYADASGKEIYGFEVSATGKETKIHKFSPEGKTLWPKAHSCKGTVTRFEVTPRGLAVVSDVIPQSNGVLAARGESKIAFLSAQDGSDLWDKAPKTKGYVQKFYVLDDGILFGLFDGGINKINFEGSPLFRKPLSTGPNIHTMALTPKGMIYITDEDANIVNLNSGESVYNKSIKYRRAEAVASTYDAPRDRYLISIGDEVIAIDGKSGDQSSLTKYDFKEKEAPTSLTVRDGGILLTSSQNMMMLAPDGSQRFHSYHASPGQSGVVKAITGVVGVASAALMVAESARAGANQDAFGNYNDAGREAKRNADFAGGIATASFQAMNKRFKATSASADAQFILTRLDDGIGLVKVDKDSGEVIGEVILKDRKPEYIVDEFGGQLFYKAKSNTIYAYDIASLRGV